VMNRRMKRIMSAGIYESAIEVIVKGDAKEAIEVAKKGLGEGIDPIELMNKGFIPGINKVGELFGSGRLFLPELVMSANAMERVTELINESIPSDQEQTTLAGTWPWQGSSRRQTSSTPTSSAPVPFSPRPWGPRRSWRRS